MYQNWNFPELDTLFCTGARVGPARETEGVDVSGRTDDFWPELARPGTDPVLAISAKVSWIKGSFDEPANSGLSCLMTQATLLI
jgi:hypothetical protein